MPRLLSNFSIRSQILISTLPVMLMLGLLIYLSVSQFTQYKKTYDQLEDIQKQSLIFMDMGQDIIELQRNVLVYSYAGYRGVLRKIEYLYEDLENEFEEIKAFSQQDPKISERFDRMYDHYMNYKDGFSEAVKEREELDKLYKNTLLPLFEENYIILTRLQNIYSAKDIGVGHQLLLMKHAFYRVNVNIEQFRSHPDASLITEGEAFIGAIERHVEKLAGKIDKKEDLELFLSNLQLFDDAFKDIVRISRIYLNLVNVVLAGKAAEIRKLSDEIIELEEKYASELSDQIKRSMKDSQLQLINLSFLAVLGGLISAVLISIGISRPVRAMAQTLCTLAMGGKVDHIPGQDRKDEVGEMAMAANEFKLMAEDLDRQRGALKQANAELEEFAYRTSHDLRSPLISAIALADITKQSASKGDTEKTISSLDMITTSLKKLETLVTDILALTQTKNAEEDIVEVNVDEIIDETIAKLSYMDNFEKLKVIKDISFKGFITARKSRLVLIIENLISNAIKYQDESEKEPFLKVSFEEDVNFVLLSVEDNGLGIDEEYQDQLFSMFKRFHPKVSFGSGLGLYMMKKSADILGGSLFYQNTGNGSRFTLRIPKKVEF